MKHSSNTPTQSQWVLFILVCGVCTVCALFADNARELLRYQGDLIQTKEYWRLLSAHFVHLGWSHFVLNLAGFLGIWLIYGGLFKTLHWIAIIVLGALGISFSFVLFDPGLYWYVGLSGVLHTLFAAALTLLVLKRIFVKDFKLFWEDILLLFFLVAKLIYEQKIGAIPFTESGSGGPVVVNAHFFGAIMGCIYVLFLFKFMHFETTNKK